MYISSSIRYKQGKFEMYTRLIIPANGRCMQLHAVCRTIYIYIYIYIYKRIFGISL